MNTTHTPAPVEAGAFTGFWCPNHGRYCEAHHPSCRAKQLVDAGGPYLADACTCPVPARDPRWMRVLAWLSDRFVR